MKNILVVFGVVLLAWFGLSFFDMTSSKNSEEQEFNESGRAKAIESETDLWNIYEGEESNLSFKYPHSVSFAGREMQLLVEDKKIDDLDYPGFDKEETLVKVEALKKGELVDEDIFVLDSSKKIRNLGEINIQEYMVLSRFEICDVTFERKALIFDDNRRIIVTVKGNRDLITSTMPKYFEKNVENCQDDLIWDFEKMDDFYKTLSEGKGSMEAQRWFDSFDQVVDTIKFEDNEVGVNTKSLLVGKWTSLDDANSVIEFTATEKIDYYDREEMSRDEFQVYFSKANQTKDDDGSHLIVASDGEAMEYTIVHVGANDLELNYLARGNTLKYTR